MVRKIFLFLFCMSGFIISFAQSSSMTSAELRFRNSIERYLKEEGFVPTIDDDDNSVNFKKEGDKFWITVQGDGPYYIRFHKGGYTLNNTNRQLMLEACNHANRNKRCGKACVGSESVFFTVEYYCRSFEAFKKTFYDNMRSLSTVKKATSDYYNEHDE